MNDLDLLGALIRERRRELKLTQDELAERAELHSVSIARIETGALNVTFKTLLRLSAGLEMSPCDLMCRFIERQKLDKA
jgi:transcriptional regulator with XRE-family HTH domain